MIKAVGACFVKAVGANFVKAVGACFVKAVGACFVKADEGNRNLRVGCRELRRTKQKRR